MWGMVGRWKRWALIVSVALAVAIVTVPAVRTPILLAAGWALVVDEPAGPADVIVVVTSADHSRRLRRVLRRATNGQPTRVMIRSARRSEFNPDRWWENRTSIRTGIVELQKLLLDVVRHPIS